MSNYMIETNNLSKQFRHHTAVNGIDLRISQGSIHGFVGPNGAGKTTTIKMLIGAILPSKGKGFILNAPIGSIEAKKNIGYMPEKAQFYKDMKTLNYLVYMGQLSGLAYKESIKKANELLDVFSLADFCHEYPRNFSSGMKKKLMLAQSLIHEPKILILDEPTANLDPDTRIFMMERLKEWVKKKGLTVFVSSHILTELELFVDEVTLLDRGEIILSGNLSMIKNRFKQGVLEIKTSNNQRLKQELDRVCYIDLVKMDGESLYVYTQHVEQFKRDISELLYHCKLQLHAFHEEMISLNQVYKTVFGLKKDDKK